jgi:signal transduction histidine kinase
MDARGIAGRIATAATGFGLAAALVPLLPFGIAESPFAVVAVVVASVVVWLSLFATAADDPRELEDLTRALATDERRVPTLHAAQPDRARLAVEVQELLAGLDTDLIRHRDARLEAQKEDESETEFLTELSHELRTPLNSILGFSQVLLDEIDGPLTPSQREDVETIRSSGSHLSALVDDVLDMAALQSGQVQLARRPVRVAMLVAEVERLLRGQLRDKPVELKRLVEDDLPPLVADEKRVRQILMNLGTNALKFTESGEVCIEAVAEDGGVRFTVHDTGPGIPPGDRDSIFHEFTQVSGSVLRRTQGSGLGLAIVKRLTDLHGGRIWLDSVTGEGSSFHVWLPAGEDA